jgi:hypothetical protein
MERFDHTIIRAVNQRASRSALLISDTSQSEKVFAPRQRCEIAGVKILFLPAI